MRINQWEVWLARVRFEDSPEVKPRPVVVVGGGEVFVCAYKVTSHPPRPVWGEYVLKQWQAIGLRRESTVRLSKRIRLESRDMIHRIGTLDPIDILSIQNILMRTC